MDEATKKEVQHLLAGIKPPPRSRFSRPSLILKIGTGYAAMAVFTISAIAFSCFNLYAINNAAREIGKVDLPVINTLIKLRGSLLAQESFAGKYAILKDPAFIELFRQRGMKASAALALLDTTDSAREIDDLKRLYLEYQTASELAFSGRPGGPAELHASEKKLLAALDACYFKRQDLLQSELQRADNRLESTIRWAIWISSLGFLLTFWVAPLVTYRIFGALGKLQTATHRIAKGDFSCDQQVPAAEEIKDLTSDFNQMAARLKELEQMNQDCLPLTRLPGNQAIERVLAERLQGGSSFSFCSVSLENFLPFNAHYGYAKGSELLRTTGYLIFAAVNEHGTPADFAGHVGGCEFVMVVATERLATVCQAVIDSFDAEIVQHFDAGDLKAGGIARCDRYGVHRFFPITTIAITVLPCSASGYASPVEITRAAADFRDYAKKQPGSRWEVAS
jgi:GGDEF domain-containing protein